MTKEQLIIVKQLHLNGYGYKRIASKTGISPNTIKSYFQRHPASTVCSVETSNTLTDSLCANCGLPVHQLEGRKKKKFCSDRCRYSWWSHHEKKFSQSLTCRFCGKPIPAIGNRKYCSHSCYIQDRFGSRESKNSLSGISNDESIVRAEKPKNTDKAKPRYSEEEFHNECAYAITMHHVLRMLTEGIITKDEFYKMNQRMKEKYHPATDGLIVESQMRIIEKDGSQK